jgi:hypothetical protein
MGAITRWLLLGPYKTGLGCGPTPDQMRLDFLTDGTIPADIWTPKEGDEIATDCGAAAACLEWACDLAALGDSSLDCGAFPSPRVVFFDSPETDGYIDLNAFWGGGFGGDPPGNFNDLNETVMAYAWTYVINTTPDPITAMVGHNSDDSHRILVNFEEASGSPAIACRAPDRGTFDQDVLGPVILKPGHNVVLSETWEGGGNWGFHLRFIDEAGEPISSPTLEIADPLEFPPDQRQKVFVSRDLPDGLVNGASGTVTFLVSPRFGSGQVVIKEKPPAGLTPSNPSNGGSLAAGTITWSLGLVDKDITLTYTLAAAADASDSVFTDSTATVDGGRIGIGGDSTYTGSPFTVNGFIKLWSHLGPLAWSFPARPSDDGPPGACDANGGAELPVDWIVNADGSITESSILPFPGVIVRPKYGGDGVTPGSGARAAGLTLAAGPSGSVVQDRFPVWHGSLSRSDTIDHGSPEVNGFDAEDHLTMSCVYVTNHTGAAIDTMIGLGSDDSIQILLNDVDLTETAPGLPGGIVGCRGWGIANEEQNTAPVKLPDGESRLLVKVIDGCCASGFRLRFQDPADPTGPGLRAPDITLSLESQRNRRQAEVVRGLAKDTYTLGEKASVSLASTAPAPVNMLLSEVLPPNTTASNISDNGSESGGVIRWDLTNVTNKTVSYQLGAGSCAGDLVFGQSSFKVGLNEVVVSGKPAVLRAYGQGDLGLWDSRDIGTTGGSAEKLGGHEILLNGTGAGIKGQADEFHFVSVPATGDFEVSAGISCFDDPSKKGQISLMVRDSFDADAVHAFIGLSFKTPLIDELTLKGNFRATAGAGTSLLLPTGSPREIPSLPIYFKIKRAGTLLTFSRSADGVSYTEAATREIGTGGIGSSAKINFGERTLIGLAVSGGGGGSTRADFRDVSGPEFGAAEGPTFHRGDTDDNGQLQLTDAVRILGFLFLGGASPTCLDAADSDDNGQLQLTDAVRILGFLFLGGAALAPPGPPGGGNPCGTDPGQVHLGCAAYTKC